MIEHEGRVFDDSNIRPYQLAKRAWSNLKNNECEIVMVYGMPEGVGKSYYVHHATADVLGFFKEKDRNKCKWMWESPAKRTKNAQLWEPDYEGVKPLVKYEPVDVVSWLMNMLVKGLKVPMWHWDDGGTWLGGMEFNDPFVISFMEFLPLARSVCGLVTISTPVEEWVLKKLHTATGIIHAPVIKLGGDAHFWKPRQCRAYRKVRFPSYTKYIPQYQWEDNFVAIGPDSFHKWYKPLRDHYTLLAVAKMQLALEKRKAKGVHVEIDETLLAQIKESIAKANDKCADFREVIAQKVAD